MTVGELKKIIAPIADETNISIAGDSQDYGIASEWNLACGTLMFDIVVLDSPNPLIFRRD